MGGFCRGFLRKGQLDPTEAGGTRGERKGAPPQTQKPNSGLMGAAPCLVGR